MIVNQFSTFPYGGAGTAAVRHHWEMMSQGVDSRFFHQAGLDRAPTHESIRALPVVEPPQSSGFFANRSQRKRRRNIVWQYERHLQDRPKDLELFSQAETIDSTYLDAKFDWGDVVQLHWLAFLADYPSFFKSMPASVPIVWTLHDMNPFTGGCHYADGCARFANACGHCPSIPNAGRKDISSYTMQLKRRALAERQIHVVTPSRWLQRLARQSPVWPAGTQFQVIANGLNTNQFRPLEKSAARQKLGLPPQAKLLAFGAEDVQNPRKGFHSLLQALRMMPEDQPVECIVFGRGELPTDRSGLPVLHEMGFIDGPEHQSAIYSAADVFVLPSLEDNAPQTGLEAMACGTPVVAYESGGIPEFVMPGQTGLLAPVGNVAALARQIGDLASHDRLRQRLAAGARRLIESEYDVRKQVRKYIDLYATLVANAKSATRRAA